MSQNCQIIYSVVVRGTTAVLSEYSTASGNFIQFAKTIITKVYYVNLSRLMHKMLKNPSIMKITSSIYYVRIIMHSSSWQIEASRWELHLHVWRIWRPHSSIPSNLKWEMGQWLMDWMINFQKYLNYNIIYRFKSKKLNTIVLQKLISWL